MYVYIYNTKFIQSLSTESSGGYQKIKNIVICAKKMRVE